MRASSTRPDAHVDRVAARVFGDREQRVDRQHRLARSEGEPLGDRAGGAQAGEGAGPATEGDRVERADRTPAVSSKASTSAGRWPSTCAPPSPSCVPDAPLCLERDVHALGGGVEGEQGIHGSARRAAGLAVAAWILAMPNESSRACRDDCSAHPSRWARAFMVHAPSRCPHCADRALVFLLVPLPARASWIPAADAALARAKVPRRRDGGDRQEVGCGAGAPAPGSADQPVNPASMMKLVTTYAALELLGRGLHLDHAGLLRRPVVERRARGQPLHQGPGRSEAGDRAAVAAAAPRAGAAACARPSRRHRARPHAPSTCRQRDPAAFDGEPLRPYNAAPDALLLNFKSVS